MDWMRALDQEALSVEASDITQYQGRVDVIGQLTTRFTRYNSLLT